MDQEYGDNRDNLAFRADLGPQADPFLIYRVDGLLYAQGQEPRPMSEIDPNDSASLAVTLYSDVRRDLQRMAVLTDDFSYVGEEDLGGVSTHHYRVTLTLAPGANPATVPSQAKGPRPADLWIGANGLPVRVDVKYSEPLGGLPGTGVSRTDYSAWSEPLDLDPASLELGLTIASAHAASRALGRVAMTASLRREAAMSYRRYGEPLRRTSSRTDCGPSLSA